MQALGDYLKKKRKAQNISLSDVADYTKISIIYLECLENNDFKKIPAKAYVRGYISSYAACVGIDHQEALNLYDASEKQTHDPEEPISGILPDEKGASSHFFRLNKKAGLALAAGIAMMLSIGLSYSFFQNHKKAATGIDSHLNAPRTLPPAPISKTAYASPRKEQNINPSQFRNQGGFPKAIETRQADAEQNDGISYKSDLQRIQRPKQNLTISVSDKSVAETPGANGLSGSTDVPILAENNLKIIEAAACSSVKDRSPQGPGNSFEWSMDKIFIWTRIECDRLPSSIRHIYYFKGKKVNDILLNIRSSHWRTWSYKTLSDKRYIGPWRVDIAANDGKLLQTINFRVN